MTKARSLSYCPVAVWIFFLRTCSFVIWFFHEMFSNLRWHLISKDLTLFSNSVVKVHDSEAYRNMDMTRERITFIFDSRDIGFSFVRAAVASSILHRTFGFESLPEKMSPRFLKTAIFPNCCHLTLISQPS